MAMFRIRRVETWHPGNKKAVVLRRQPDRKLLRIEIMQRSDHSFESYEPMP
jgi:hypothetical protein